ncbi:MAG: pilus assembly FimT family protein [Nitrospirota bacterium]
MQFGSKNKRGSTVTELIVVIAVAGIMTGALAFEFRGWLGKYKAESQLKDFYSDFMHARTEAMHRNRNFYADFPDASSYRIREDTDDDNDYTTLEGDTILPAFPKQVLYPVRWSGGTLIFRTRGLVQPSATPLGATLCIVSGDDPDYDCMVISQTRINLGKLKDRDGACNAANCAIR